MSRKTNDIPSIPLTDQTFIEHQYPDKQPFPSEIVQVHYEGRWYAVQLVRRHDPSPYWPGNDFCYNGPEDVWEGRHITGSGFCGRASDYPRWRAMPSCRMLMTEAEIRREVNRLIWDMPVVIKLKDLEALREISE